MVVSQSEVRKNYAEHLKAQSGSKIIYLYRHESRLYGKGHDNILFIMFRSKRTLLFFNIVFSSRIKCSKRLIP